MEQPSTEMQMRLPCYSIIQNRRLCLPDKIYANDCGKLFLSLLCILEWANNCWQGQKVVVLHIKVACVLIANEEKI